MTTMVRRSAPVFPEWFSFLDNVWPFTDFGSIRVESYVDDGRFVVRAEVPGIDPAKEAEITVGHGRLTVTVRREQHHEQTRHSEFHYGSFSRSVLLPTGAKVDKATAIYTDGILEVAVPIDTAGPDKPTTIEIKTK
ncbi:MAG TPA: Hsp20/alpha crystallin family protein [Pseudonocardiaceae bacterium]